MSYIQSVRAPGSAKFIGNIAVVGDVPVSPAKGDIYHLTGDVTISGVAFLAGNEIIYTGSAWELLGKDGYATKAVTANYTLTLFDQVVTVAATSAAVAVTLPDATANVGKTYMVKATDITNAVTLVPAGSDKIENVAGAYAYASAGDSLTVVATAGNWAIV